MKIKSIVAIGAIIALFIPKASQAQGNDLPELLTVGGGLGFMLFNGDLSSDKDFSKQANIKTGYSIMLEKRFGSWLGVQLNGTFGKLAYNEIAREVSISRNFESKIIDLNANFLLHLDNDKVFKKDAMWSPFLGAGVGYTLFDPHGDLKNKNGLTYHYWSDGSIRSIAENDPMAGSAEYITKDYVYESPLTDSATDYSRNTISIPLTAGIKMKFNENFQGRIFATYNLTTTDWMDNVADNGDNDAFLNTGISLHYIIRKKNPNKITYKDVDIKSMKEEDSDGDGVMDTWDRCQGTPKGAKVDPDGCPLDSDKDGVADYMDKEDSTALGALVDENGVTLTEEKLSENFKEYETGVESEKVSVNEDNESLNELNKIAAEMHKNPSGKKLAMENADPSMSFVDKDKDGYITQPELLDIISSHVKGDDKHSIGSINTLIAKFKQLAE